MVFLLMSDTADLRPSIKKKRQVKLPSSLPPVPCPQFPVPSSLSPVCCLQFPVPVPVPTSLSQVPCPQFAVPSFLPPSSLLETGNLGQGTGDRELGAGNWGSLLPPVPCPISLSQFLPPVPCRSLSPVCCPQFPALHFPVSSSLFQVPCPLFAALRLETLHTAVGDQPRLSHL